MKLKFLRIALLSISALAIASSAKALDVEECKQNLSISSSILKETIDIPMIEQVKFSDFNVKVKDFKYLTDDEQEKIYNALKTFNYYGNDHSQKLDNLLRDLVGYFISEGSLDENMQTLMVLNYLKETIKSSCL